VGYAGHIDEDSWGELGKHFGAVNGDSQHSSVRRAWTALHFFLDFHARES
jgi:hypothetical protein